MSLPPPLPIAENAINRHSVRPDYRDPYDFYIEDRWCADVLLDAFPTWRGVSLDPACGSGRIVDACRRRGFDALASDLLARSCPGCVPGIDFTSPGAYPAGSVDYLISNPPFYGSAGVMAFVENGLAVARKAVAVLAPITFAAGQERHAWFKGLPWSHFCVLSARSSMPPGLLLEAGAVRQRGGKEDYAWFVFTHGWDGPPLTLLLMPPPDVMEAMGRGKRKKRGRAVSPAQTHILGDAS